MIPFRIAKIYSTNFNKVFNTKSILLINYIKKSLPETTPTGFMKNNH
ncbi:hypothetical protein FEM21_29440 [Flavobacterium seoulense]|uniref:Uncharacterized protein n=1 Tax=Flavobacterium seoulense TaxID=1492738 RepID=A0A066WTD4_9FLAO|nr:hypothetical protein FEM21_29440 [Flavobacterium seoulense]